MVAIRAHFDGKKVVIPKEIRGAPAGDVFVIFPDLVPTEGEKLSWLKAQEAAFAKAWENDEDAVYDSL